VVTNRKVGWALRLLTSAERQPGQNCNGLVKFRLRQRAPSGRYSLPPHLEDEFPWCTSLVKEKQGRPLPNDIHTWSRFTIRVAPTIIKDEDGILQLLVTDPVTGTDQLIAEATGEFGLAS
jgi:hypothetical protein